MSLRRGSLGKEVLLQKVERGAEGWGEGWGLARPQDGLQQRSE